MKRNRNVLIAIAVALGTGACSAQVTPPAAPTVEQSVATTERGGMRSQTVITRAKVESIDQKTRTVGLLGHDGAKEIITAGPEVRNLAQISKGDDVIVTYFQAVAFEVLAKGNKKSGATIADGMLRAEPGQTPGGAAVTVGTVVVDVLELDPKASKAVIRGHEGNSATIDIRNPAVFQKVKVGDRVEITMAEAMAVDVEKAPAKQ